MRSSPSSGPAKLNTSANGTIRLLWQQPRFVKRDRERKEEKEKERRKMRETGRERERYRLFKDTEQEIERKSWKKRRERHIELKKESERDSLTVRKMFQPVLKLLNAHNPPTV